MTMEILWTAAFAIVTGLTGRLAISTVVTVKASIVATALARFGNFRKVEVIIIIGICIFFIGIFDRIGFKFRVDYYTGLLELDITAPATFSRQAAL